MRGYGYYPDYFPIVEAQLSSLIELSGGETLLDLGCGKGALAAYARQDLGVTAVGLDRSRYATACAARARDGGMTVRGDGGQLPFAARSFDVVWCNGVLQYFEAEAARASMRETARVARRVAFISNIAAAQRRTEWGRRDRLTRLFLRPRQWAALAESEVAARGWSCAALPFEGESAILMFRAEIAGKLFPLRFAELALERMQRLGVLTRTPPGMDAFYRAYA